MSTSSVTRSAPATVRRAFRAIASWQRRAAKHVYSPVFSIALLLIVGVAVKFGH
jgi:hypothetical protein